MLECNEEIIHLSIVVRHECETRIKYTDQENNYFTYNI